ncbi:MAG: ChbG/HpnK family deacetylase [Ignavibacteria bacterium]|nr:ChbG/HpnK family deacetylase [Ignavibacteria bacterium]
MKKFILTTAIVLLAVLVNAQIISDSVVVLIRCDDSGMSNSTNLALEKFAATKIPFSTSVMFACPWYQQAVDILKANPHISVGIHLTLNAEWKNYRWGPILGKEVPSLTDTEGYFFPSRKTLYENNPKLDEVEKELHAQVKRAVRSGLQIDYIDYHMGTAVDKPEYRAIVEKLAKEYKLGISRYFGEFYTDNMYSAPIEMKKDTLIDIITNRLEKGKVNLLVCHLGIDNDELRAMLDLNPFGPTEMSRHRQAELDAMLSSDFIDSIKSNKIKIITYRDLITLVGSENMVSPLDSKK